MTTHSKSPLRFLWYLILFLLLYPFIVQFVYNLLNFWGTYVFLFLISTYAYFKVRRPRHHRQSLPSGPAEREPFEPFTEREDSSERWR